MRASVDVSSLVVRCGDSSWPFQLDLVQGAASIVLDNCVYEVCPLTWRAKLRLAWFAHMEENFVQARFLEACLRTPKTSPTGECNQAVLVALASWINLPSDKACGMPLDRRRLAGVTVELCRALGVGPMALAELDAAEVEVLWQNMDHETAKDEIPDIPLHTRPSQEAAPPHASEQEFNTKIVIIPDETLQSANVPRIDSLQPALRSEHEAEGYSAPRPTDNGESEGAVAQTAQVSGETKRDVLAQDRVAAGNERNNTARFRVTLDKPTASASKQTAATFRLPVSQPRRASQSRANPQERMTSVLTATEDIDRSEGPTSTDTSLNFDTSEQLFSPSLLVQLPVQPRVQPGYAETGPASHLWPEFGETNETESFPPVEVMECMLDEFCERLAEAAADLGIMEEV